MKKGFLSLKWQAVISVSLILVLGIGLLTYLGKKNLEQTYINQRDRVFQDRHQAVTSALKSMQLQMMHLASHMQGLAGQTDSTSPLFKDNLEATLKKNWDQLNFEWGVDSITLYNTNGEILSSLGPPSTAQLLPKAWIIDTGHSETPIAQVWCYRSCWQVVVVPVLLDESNTGILVLSQSLADAVLQFQSSTAAHVGILIPQDLENNDHPFEMRSITDWRHNVVALTGAPVTYTILKLLSSEMSMDALGETRAVQSWQQKDFEVSLISLTESSSSRGASLVILENVSADLQRLQSTLSNLFLAALLILLLAEAALLWLLWVPMSRLKTVAQTLPKLARNNRQNALQSLDVQENKPRIRNEIHDLFDSAILLSRTLQELDSTVKVRTKGLKIRSRELLEERNFVTTLLNSVHAVILTQDTQGNIKLLNSEGRRLLGISEDDVKNHQFSDYIENTDKEKVQVGLQQLFTRSVNQVRHESDFYGPSTGLLHMDWHHTRLPDSATNETLALSVGLDLTARKHAETNFAWLADHDPLTELFNRRGFQDEFEKILKKSARTNHPGALIFLDLDQFKTVNDTSGHPTGDRLLCEVANKLGRGVREVDVLARLGGDEFAIIAEEINREGAIALAEKLCGLIGDTEVVVDDTTHRITISLGIALFPEHGVSVDELMANVDLAMYKAKSGGDARNNWHVYSIDAPEKRELHVRVDWKARIQKALDEERFVLYYQPIYDIGNTRTSHYEALVRMIDKQGEIIAPGLFIPVAEKTGLIYEIDRYVLKQAVIDLKKFHEQGRHITMSVNLSATAIAKIDFISSIEQLVRDYDVDRSHLIFELTETSAVEDVVTTAEVIGKCRRLGYQFSLDDFGVGFASWFYLRQLPVDFVKIDGSFIRDMSSNDEDRLFVKAINDVAQGLGKKTVAEFVENAESLEMLKELGVDYAQGYYIGKPQPELLESEDRFSGTSIVCQTDRAVTP